MSLNSIRKEKLVTLGVDQLADALLELASYVDAADDLVERMIATPLGNIKRFTEKLSDLKQGHRFIDWRESAGFAREIETLLDDLRAGVTDPRIGVELVASFYEADSAIFENCDDSSGAIGDVLRHDACKLFVGYASCCADKEWLGDLVFRVIQSDGYGVRDVLIESALEYLSEAVIRAMVARMQEKAGQASDDYHKREWLRHVESLARQLKDAPLFEQTRLASRGELSTAACLDIARVHLQCGNEQTAITWLEKIPESDTFKTAERDDLLFEIHGRTGNRAGRAEVAWRIFRRSRNAASLALLLNAIGNDQRSDVLASEVAAIHESIGFSLVDAVFLVEIEKLEEAESYLMNHRDQLNGDYYGGLLPLVEIMEKNGRLLCTTVIYRALLDSILRRGQTKSYSHGVRYLRKLDLLAHSISDWHAVIPHDAYLQDIKLNHGRKSSFWSQYGSRVG